MKAKHGTLAALGVSLTFAGSYAEAQPLVHYAIKTNLPAAAVPAANTGIHILSPTAADIQDIPSADITVECRSDSNVDLEVNGVSVPAYQIGRTEIDPGHGTVTHTWIGVGLHQGINDISAWLNTDAGRVLADHVRVHVRGEAHSLVLTSSSAKIPADGRSTTIIHGALVDEYGIPSNADVPVTIDTSGGAFLEPDACPDMPGYQIQAHKGEFTVTLRAASTTGTVTIKANAGGMSDALPIEMTPDFSHPMAAGVLDLRIGPGATRTLGDGEDVFPTTSSAKNGVAAQGTAFVKTPVGDWLLTGAYNSSRPLNRNASGQDGLAPDTQSMDQQYPTYGDNSTIEHVADSADNLYLRLEKNHDLLQYGAYGTTEFADASQQFTAITRTFQGFKTHIEDGRTQITGLYAGNIRGFQRDTIAPDGTGGYYYLSQRPIVIGSENVFIETQELSRPGVVLSSVQQTQGTDYDIDYDQGSILFHSPVLRTEADQSGNVLVHQIVVTYEFENAGSSAHAYGARLRYQLSGSHDNADWIGGTYFTQDQGLRSFTLSGLDSHIRLPHCGILVAEYANSRNTSELLGPVSGSAFRLDWQQPFAHGVKTHTYWQTAQTGFANDATTSFVPGQTRYGAEISAPLAPATHLKLQVDREINRGIAPQDPTTSTDSGDGGTPVQTPGTPVDNALTTITAGVDRQQGKSSESLNVLRNTRTDAINPTTLSGNSTQLQTTYTNQVSPNVNVAVSSLNSLGSQADPVTSDATSVGVRWKVTRSLAAGVAEQVLTRGQFAGKAITSVILDSTSKPDKDSSVINRLVVQQNAGAINVQTATRGEQNWKVAPGLNAKVYDEHVSGDLVGNTAAGPQLPLPYVVGASSASLGTTGGDTHGVSLDYHGKNDLRASARYELRTSDMGSNTLITAAAQGHINSALTGVADYQMAGASNQGLSNVGNSVYLRLGLAYRNPRSDSWNVLFHYDYRVLPSTIPVSIAQSSGMGTTGQTLAVEGIYSPSWQWEFYGKYAVRHSQTDLAQDYTSVGLISLAQLRATYRFRYNMDLNAEGRWVSQPTVGAASTSLAVDVGYYLSSSLRLAVGYAFGRSHDIDFTGQSFAGGPYLGLTLGIDQLFGDDGVQKIAPSK